MRHPKALEAFERRNSHMPSPAASARISSCHRSVTAIIKASPFEQEQGLPFGPSHAPARAAMINVAGSKSRRVTLNSNTFSWQAWASRPSQDNTEAFDSCTQYNTASHEIPEIRAAFRPRHTTTWFDIANESTHSRLPIYSRRSALTIIRATSSTPLP